MLLIAARIIAWLALMVLGFVLAFEAIIEVFAGDLHQGLVLSAWSNLPMIAAAMVIFEPSEWGGKIVWNLCSLLLCVLLLLAEGI